MKAWPIFFCMASVALADGMDPLAYAYRHPEKSWRLSMQEFQALDRDDDGMLTDDEAGQNNPTSRSLYHISGPLDDIPFKWTTGINFVWNDHTKPQEGVRGWLLGMSAKDRHAFLRVFAIRKHQARIHRSGPRL